MIRYLFCIALLYWCAAALCADNWPPREGKLRVIIDTDAACEIDDVWALALALGRPDRFQIEGIVAAHFGDFGGAKGIDSSFKAINRALEKAGLSDKFPVKRGVDPIAYKDRLENSDGIEFIIERAKTATPEDPLWLILLGPATDGVAALMREPKIADRTIVLWHSRSDWPNECLNFNAINDTKAARMLFETKCRLVLFDTGANLTMPPEESERRYVPLGPLGTHLHEIRKRNPDFMSPKKGVFDLGDIAALVDPACVKFEKTKCPRVKMNMRYDFEKTDGELMRIYQVNRDTSFNLLEDALKRIYNK